MFYRLLVDKEGQKYVDSLFKDRNVVVKADLKFYLDLIERYTQLVQELN